MLVSAEDDAEVRRVSISNTGTRVREIEVTSYAELVLAPQAADIAHPAFSKLFVETEYLADVGAILATRRRRAPSEPEIWAAHLAVVDGEAVGKPEIETDRARFLGRGHGVRTPIAVIDGRPLSNTVGTVLDPVFALRRRVRVAPGATVRIAFWTWPHPPARRCSTSSTSTATPPPSSARRRWPGPRRRFSSITSASPRARPACSSVSPDTCIYASAGAAAVLRRHPARRRRAVGPVAQGISGDLPIVLLRISDTENLDVARELLQAHEYWRMKRLAVDLVILNERASSYVQDLQIALETLVRTSQSRPQLGEERTAGPRLRAARRPDPAGDTRPSRVGRAGRARRRSAAASPISSTVRRIAESLPGPFRSGLSPLRRRRSRRLCRTSSSSTGSAASPRTAGNM